MRVLFGSLNEKGTESIAIAQAVVEELVVAFVLELYSFIRFVIKFKND